MDKSFGSCYIRSNRDIVYVTESQKIHIVGFMRLGVQRIAEEQQQIYFIAGDPCADLLTAALTSSKVSCNIETRCLCDLFNRRNRCSQLMTLQYTAVCNSKLKHTLFFGIMC